jgi:anti-sigma B factor antagonist
MASTDTLVCQTQTLADGWLLILQGDVNFTSSPKLRVSILELINHKPDRLVIDLAGVPYMDSSGVATIVEALQLQRRANRKLVLSALQPKVMGIFEIARLHTMFNIVPDTQAALLA